LLHAVRAALKMGQSDPVNLGELTAEQVEKVTAAIRERNADLIDPAA
jgi:hypothetical protein